jgi:hypothetical protein
LRGHYRPAASWSANGHEVLSIFRTNARGREFKASEARKNVEVRVRSNQKQHWRIQRHYRDNRRNGLRYMRFQWQKAA